MWTRRLRRTLARFGSRLGGHLRTVCRRHHHTNCGSLSRRGPSTRPRHRRRSLRRRGGTKNHHGCGGGCSHRSSCGLLSRRNWHQADDRWLPGFKGPIPSTTLDERRATFTCWGRRYQRDGRVSRGVAGSGLGIRDSGLGDSGWQLSRSFVARRKCWLEPSPESRFPNPE